MTNQVEIQEREVSSLFSLANVKTFFSGFTFVDREFSSQSSGKSHIWSCLRARCRDDARENTMENVKIVGISL